MNKANIQLNIALETAISMQILWNNLEMISSHETALSVIWLF